MRCSDIVMSAMSYHPSHSKGRVARGYWDFVAGWQSEKGDLHHLGGQWYTLELASRFRFRSVRRILKQGLPLAARRQRQDGGFQADYPAGSACEVVLAYSRHGMLKELCGTLPHDPVPLIASSRRALAVKTRREALGASRRDLATLADELVAGIVGRQRSDASWDGLVLATVGAVHDLLDCGLSPQEKRVRKACQWLCAQQKPLDRTVFPRAPRTRLDGMLYADQVSEEVAWEKARHPEYRWRPSGKECLDILPTYQTAAALSALCRCGLVDAPEVRRGFEYLMHIRGPGGRNYTHFWCNCAVNRWLRAKLRPLPNGDA